MKKWIRSSTNTQIDLNEYDWISNVDGYQVYRKIVEDADGSTRGVWVAQDQDRNYPPFSITYRQARGYDPITEHESNARRLSREVGQMLFGSQDLSSNASNNRLIITIQSRINFDGFDAEVVADDGSVLFEEKYSYGYNASYDRRHAEYAHQDVLDGEKYGWAPSTYRREKPYVADIINELCTTYDIDPANIEIIAGRHQFNGSEITPKEVSEFIEKYVNASETINTSKICASAVATTYDRNFPYTRGNQKYRVYVKHENDPYTFQFAMNEVHPYDEADYAWAQKTSPVDLEVIRHGKVISCIPLPEWDEDMYDDPNEYFNELLDIASVALKEANSDVTPMMSHM